MRYLGFLLLFFGLPHVVWLPNRLGFAPEAVPLGIANLLLLAALGLWAIGKVTGSNAPNPFRVYTAFVGVSLLWVAVAFSTGFSHGYREILTPAKQQIALLLLYFVPLAAIRDRRDFRVVGAIAIAVHVVIGLEVFRSGVLGGSAFHDGKRGSGPFGAGYTGSDVGGAYLAQTIMLALALIVGRGVPLVVRGGAAAGAVVMLLGIFATYSRGSLLAVAFGLLVIVAVRGVGLKTVALAGLITLGGLALLPESTRTRFDQTVDDEGRVDESTEGRLRYYEMAWEVFLDHPIGVGTGQTRAAMEQYLHRVDTHNAFLQTLVEFGVVGLVMLFSVLVSMGWRASSLARDDLLPWDVQAYGLGMAGFLGSLVVCNMFYSNLYKDLVLGTVALHLGLLAWTCAERESLAEEEDPELTPEESTAFRPAHG